MNDMKRKVIERFNKELGSTYSNLTRCYDIQKNLQEEKISIAKQISGSNDEVSSKVSLILRNIEKTLDEINKVTEKSKNLSADVNKHIHSADEIISKSQQYKNKIELLELTAEYFKISKKIENISSELHQAIIAKDDELSVTLFANLCEISLSLQDSPATHLVSYLRDVLHHWHNYLKNKFSSEFDEVLTAIKWPFVSTNFNLATPSVESINKLQLLTEYLIQIQIPEERSKPVVTSALLSDFPPLSLPMQFLVRPLRKRFLYHFYGTKQTNRPDKPEWYFTQILTWIRDHEKFIQTTIQPVIDRLAMHHINARSELIRGLVQLCVEKLHAELPNLAYDDNLFSHCVDEALGMSKELQEAWGYPSSQPGPLGPLTHAPILQKWLCMEKKYALKKMDAMLTSPTAWNLVTTSDTDDTRVTECGDSFITLLCTIKERYQSLPQPGHRLQFLDLQLELLDDFRVRLLQLIHDEPNDPVTSNLPHILNTVHYIETALTEQSSSIHYIHLHYFKHQFTSHGLEVTSDEPNSEQLENTEQGSVFDDAISLLIHIRTDLVHTLSEAVVMDVKARSRPYRHDTWFSMPLIKEIASLSVSVTACPLFQVLATRLHHLEEVLAPMLFSETWRNIAKLLNTFFFEELILESHFNEGGAIQLNFDMTRNLFPLFAQYTRFPEVYFKQIKEACLLLTLAKGSALLLKETLHSSDEIKAKEALAEIGVNKLNLETAFSVLNQRIDLNLVS